ncbi:MAG: hypothetical protein CMI53_04690 [Parcubacteria group bacterium]|jgi:DNA polymerase-3 subunit gamma/tau|nr:hypothetical protein [Parcubacteria group bacterium]|tara:strand:+ start:2026 stop:3621 length:1596 start_codon:yes stop_codon:yes gene_type:complete
MDLTLYRKYRPQSFKEVIGQNHVKTTVQSEIETGKVAHAYLFSGPRGLGKTTMARLLAKAVNCLKVKSGSSEPCNSCDACTELMAAKSLDIIEIDAASHTGVDNVRENIIDNARFTPTSRKFKVFIIDEVHMLSVSAFNALLKILEEPPDHVMFILATTEIHKVPETIISRCQHFEFRKVTEAEIVGRLNQLVTKEKRSVDKSILENIAYYADGGMRDAESLLGQILSLSDKEITPEQAELVLPRSRFDLVLEFIAYLSKKDSTAAIGLINRLVQEGIDLEKFNVELIEVLRKILLIKINQDLSKYTSGLNKDLEKRVTDISKDMTLNFLVRATEIFMAKQQDLKFATIYQLPLELAILEIIGSNQEEVNDNDNDVDSSNNNKPLATPKVDNKITERPKPEVKKQVNSAVAVRLTLDQIKEKWGEVLQNLKQYNQSLASALKIGQPGSVKDDGTLEVCFKHKFHQERINDTKNKKILESVLEEIFGVKLIVRTLVVKELPDKEVIVEAVAEKPADDSLDNILKTFGGQVVD